MENIYDRQNLHSLTPDIAFDTLVFSNKMKTSITFLSKYCIISDLTEKHLTLTHTADVLIKHINITH